MRLIMALILFDAGPTLTAASRQAHELNPVTSHRRVSAVRLIPADVIPTFDCWTVRNTPGGDYQVCTTITYLSEDQ